MKDFKNGFQLGIVIAALLFFTVFLVAVANSATLYLTTGGSGTRAAGCLTSNPCPLTVTWINANVVPGDVLLIKNGTQNCGLCLGDGYINVSGTSGARITLQCENFSPGPTGTGPGCSLMGNGAATIIKLNGDYWTIQGIRIKAADNTTGWTPGAGGTFRDEGGGILLGGPSIGYSSIVRKNIFDGVNTYANGPPIVINSTCGHLIEENDILNYHRNAIDVEASTAYENDCQGPGLGGPNVVRLNYIGRGLSREPHGLPFLGPADGLNSYNMNDTRYENNIVEDNLGDGCATGWSDRIKHLGDIVVNCATWGFLLVPTDSFHSSIDNQYRDVVVINAGFGIQMDPMQTTTGGIIYGATIINVTNTGLSINNDRITSSPAPGSRFFSGTNILSPTSEVFTLSDSGSWVAGGKVLEYSYTAGSRVGFTNQNTPGGTPSMGSCVLYTPGSFAKLGKNGEMVGADATKLYRDGVRTATSRFDFTQTGAARGRDPYGPGVMVGVNDPASGNSRYNIHQRIFGFGTGGCLSPTVGTIAVAITIPTSNPTYPTPPAVFSNSNINLGGTAAP